MIESLRISEDALQPDQYVLFLDGDWEKSWNCKSFLPKSDSVELLTHRFSASWQSQETDWIHMIPKTVSLEPTLALKMSSIEFSDSTPV